MEGENSVVRIGGREQPKVEECSCLTLSLSPHFQIPPPLSPPPRPHPRPWPGSPRDSVHPVLQKCPVQQTGWVQICICFLLCGMEPPRETAVSIKGGKGQGTEPGSCFCGH